MVAGFKTKFDLSVRLFQQRRGRDARARFKMHTARARFKIHARVDDCTPYRNPTSRSRMRLKRQVFKRTCLTVVVYKRLVPVITRVTITDNQLKKIRKPGCFFNTFFEWFYTFLPEPFFVAFVLCGNWFCTFCAVHLYNHLIVDNKTFVVVDQADNLHFYNICLVNNWKNLISKTFCCHGNSFTIRGFLCSVLFNWRHRLNEERTVWAKPVARIGIAAGGECQRSHAPQIFRILSHFVLWEAVPQTKYCCSPKIKHSPHQKNLGCFVPATSLSTCWFILKWKLLMSSSCAFAVAARRLFRSFGGAAVNTRGETRQLQRAGKTVVVTSSSAALASAESAAMGVSSVLATTRSDLLCSLILRCPDCAKKSWWNAGAIVSFTKHSFSSFTNFFRMRGWAVNSTCG